MFRKIAEAKEAVAGLRIDGAFVGMFFEPRPCSDPEAFARQCEAGAVQAVVIRFVKPGNVIREGALQ